MRSLLKVVIYFIFLIGALSCGGDPGSTSAVPNEMRSDSSFYFQTAASINIDIYYEDTAEPYTGQTAGGLEYWDVLSDNLSAIFNFRSTKPTINLPYVLEDMMALGALENESWTVSAILDLAASKSVQSKVNQQANFSVFFVNGFFTDDSGDNSNVLGVNISGSSIIFIFKDVIKASSTSANEGFFAFMEQSTIVHEMGHALGFVNGGVPMSSPHQDIENGQHSENSDCVMYYLNEGPADLRQFIIKYLTTQEVTMWGPEVLADAQAFSL